MCNGKLSQMHRAGGKMLHWVMMLTSKTCTNKGNKMKKTVEVKLQFLPPPRETCQECGRSHLEAEPHDATSLYYQLWFHDSNQRFPTWEDAMSHCDPLVKEAIRNVLSERGIDPDSVNVHGKR